MDLITGVKMFMVQVPDLNLGLGIHKSHDDLTVILEVGGALSIKMLT